MKHLDYKMLGEIITSFFVVKYLELVQDGAGNDYLFFLCFFTFCASFRVFPTPYLVEISVFKKI